jgi:diadenosine tetraphosphatase ApaH/serine/threonine PP2A family protein phosphatase
MKALLSDIHANLEALYAVIDDMAEFNVEAIYCLGDTVGYGPNPCECLDVMMHCPVVLRGNHEEAARGGTEDFKAEVGVASRWTKQQLERHEADDDDPQARRSFLDRLPLTHEEDGFLFVHGSPRDPLREYVHPDSIDDPGKMWDMFRLVKRCCFMGHTHVPGIFTPSYEFYAPEDIEGRWRLDDSKTLCNVGSVGQPRDGDWRACYVLLDERGIYFRKVPYDIAKTIQKIKQVPELRALLHFWQR